MSWLAQSKRVSQGRWVASVPKQTCPLTPLVGACCSGCAHGGSCTGEDELRVEMGRQMVGDARSQLQAGRPPVLKSCPPGQVWNGTACVLLPGNPIGIHVGAEGILWSEVEATGNAIGQLGADVPLKTPALTPEYDAFVKDWGAFVQANQEKSWLENAALAPHFISGAPLAQYKALVERYNALRAKFVAMGGATTAPTATTASPFDQAVTSSQSAIGSGVSEALGNVAAIGVYVGVGLAAAALLYLAAPLVLRKVLG